MDYLVGMQTYLTSPTLGFLLKLLSGLAVAGFGILGIGAKTRDDNGKLTRNGRIALTGIIVAGLLAIGTSVYDFATGQERERQEALKNKRLLLSVQSQLYPLKNISGNITVEFTSEPPGARQYLAMLTRALPQACHDTNEFKCYKRADGARDYYIPQNSPYFPKSNTQLAHFLDSFDVDVIFKIFAKDPNQPEFDKEDPDEKYNVLDSFTAGVGSGFKEIHFQTSNSTLGYTVRNFHVPDKELRKTAYSLVEAFPGFVLVVPKIHLPRSCYSNTDQVFQNCIDRNDRLLASIKMADVEIHFPYPKALQFYPEGGSCRKELGYGIGILSLPGDIEDLDELGNVKVSMPQDRYLDSLCASLKEP